MIQLTTTTQAETEKIAQTLSGFLPEGTVLLLRGDLGTGKTVFARALIRAMTQVPDLSVTSPTFNLALTYDTPSGLLWHFDLYRLKQEDELDELGFDEARSGRLVLVEWPDKMGSARLASLRRVVTVDLSAPDPAQPDLRVLRLDLSSLRPFPQTAFLFSAGLGERMRPLTDTCPKPLIEVAGRPILAHILDMLQAVGVVRLVVNTHYHASQVVQFLDQYRDRFEITISHEPDLLETGGGMKKALSVIKEDVFYALNGDSLLVDAPGGVPALARLALTFDGTQMDTCLLLQPTGARMITPAVGDYRMGGDGRLTRAVDRQGDFMFTGVRILHKRMFDQSPDGKFSFLVLMDRAQQAGRLFGLVHDGEWHHLSTPNDVRVVTDHLQKA